ncbi:hypothetical protein BN1708_018028, partial [Verticillium longisporum]
QHDGRARRKGRPRVEADAAAGRRALRLLVDRVVRRRRRRQRPLLGAVRAGDPGPRHVREAASGLGAAQQELPRPGPLPRQARRRRRRLR